MAHQIHNPASGVPARTARPAPPDPAFISGTPGPLFVWAKALISAAAAEFGVALDLNADLPSALGAKGGALMVYSEAPDAAFIAAAARSKGPKIAFVGDPASDFSYQQRIIGLPRFDALRAVTAAAMLCDFRPLAGLVIRLSTRPARSVVARILTELGWTQPPSERLLAAFAGAGFEEPLWSAVDRFCALALPEGRPPQSDEMIASSKVIQTAVTPIYQSAVSGNLPGPVVWPRICFFDGDNPGQTAPPWIEAAGGARILFYGPYLHLPRGVWTLSAKIAFSDDLDKSAFSIEAVAGRPLARGRVKPSRAGVFTASFSFHHDDPTSPLEVRISSDHGLIFGRMALIDVAFRPADGEALGTAS